MRWFGADWGAPICQSVEEYPTPDGVLCAHQCGHSIRNGDVGLLLPFAGNPDAEDMKLFQFTMVNGTPHLAYHLICFFDEIGVRGKTHV
jgi:hypothetical protein